jgi:hypothetical protein
MLTSINPLGERGRGYRWGPTVALFTLSSVLGGAALGLVLGGAGELLDLPLWVGAIACALAVIADLTGVIPTLRRQVDEDWLTRYRRWVYATTFGAQLGAGVATIVTSAVTYALLVLMVVAGLPGALVAGAVFGLVRALPVMAGWRATTPDRLRSLALALERGRRPAHWATVGVVALAAVGMAVG